MLAETAARVADRTRYQAPLAIGATRHGNRLRAELPSSATLLLEPSGRNSAPPIAAAALMSRPGDLLLILPADHHIEDLDSFHTAVEKGAEAAMARRIVTFGIEPDHPNTSYGYIETRGGGAVRDVIRFVEKPDRKTAELYLSAGSFYWNAGIFLFRADVMLAAFKAHAPDILSDVEQSLSNGVLDPALFSFVRAQSIDYAVMEHASNIAVVPVSMGWSDLGDFRALHRIASRGDPDATILRGPVVATQSSGIFVRSDGPRIAVHGLNDIAIAATRGAVLVTRLSDAAEVKKAAAAVSDVGLQVKDEPTWDWVSNWLWKTVMPQWAQICLESGFVEQLDMDGRPLPQAPRRGRVAPRQLFAFARARRLGWNADNVADAVIEAALAHLDGPARSPKGGWAHGLNQCGITDPRRDLYDHAFVALAGAELAMLGDPRGHALAQEAFTLIDTLFADANHGGWRDIETRPDGKFANPHMHLLEASLAHFEAVHNTKSAARIDTICALFEQFVFDARTGAVAEELNDDWSRHGNERIEPGHCYEWAFLLTEVERLTGRDTASWARRLVAFTETRGLHYRFAADHLDAPQPTFRLWPQLERLRILTQLSLPDADKVGLLHDIKSSYLEPGPAHGWVDKLDGTLQPAASAVPASMVYHLMTGLAPFAPPP